MRNAASGTFHQRVQVLNDVCKIMLRYHTELNRKHIWDKNSIMYCWKSHQRDHLMRGKENNFENSLFNEKKTNLWLIFMFKIHSFVHCMLESP